MLERKLQWLSKYLSHFKSFVVFWLLNVKPPSESRYNFNNFEPDTDWIEDIIVGAVNRQLEIQFGTRADFLFQQNNYFLSFLWVEFETQFETPWVINMWQTSAEFPTEP